MAGNTGGPWGGGGNSGGGGGKDEGSGGNRGNQGGGRGPGGDMPQIPEIDELVKKGQEQLRVLMGGGNGRERGGGGGSGGGGAGPLLTRGTVGLGVVAVVIAWLFASFYTVRPEQQSIELFLGEFSGIGTEGLNFAPWPVVSAEVFDVTTNRTEEIGVGRGASDNDGLMLTTDENIVDIDFQVVWNIKNARDFKFSLRDPDASVRAISESAMREVIAQSELAPILNRDRGAVADRVKELIQITLDNRETGINVLRVNVNKVDPPSQTVRVRNSDGTNSQASVVDAFRDVQAAEQERDRARVVNDAIGEASRFEAVLTEFTAAPDVTRKRLYIETMQKVLGDVDKIIIEGGLGGAGGQGVVPYLPLNELRRSGGSN